MQLNELQQIYRGAQRKAEIKRWTSVPVDDHLAKRARREQLTPLIPCIDASIDDNVTHYDQRAWQRVIAFYAEVDRRKERCGDATLATETEDGFRSVTSSPIRDLATVMLRFRKFFSSDSESEGAQTPQRAHAHALLDMGSNDGRVVVLAHLLGYRAQGIEIDDHAYRESLDFIKMLDREAVPGLARAVFIANGDYTSSQGLKSLMTRVAHVSVFFNYDDTNVDKVAEVIMRRGRVGARLLLHSYSERMDQIPLTLTHMVMTDGRQRGSSTDPRLYPCFDVFRRDR